MGEILVTEDGAVKSFARNGEILLQTTSKGGFEHSTTFKDARLVDVPGWFPCEGAVEWYLQSQKLDAR